MIAAGTGSNEIRQETDFKGGAMEIAQDKHRLKP